MFLEIAVTSRKVGSSSLPLLSSQVKFSLSVYTVLIVGVVLNVRVNWSGRGSKKGRRKLMLKKLGSLVTHKESESNPIPRRQYSR
jgi:hypothetical protein